MKKDEFVIGRGWTDKEIKMSNDAAAAEERRHEASLRAHERAEIIVNSEAFMRDVFDAHRPGSAPRQSKWQRVGHRIALELALVQWRVVTFCRSLM